VSRYSAIIVFIVIFSHESIPLVLKKEFGIEDLLVAIGFSLLGAIPTLVIDTLKHSMSVMSIMSIILSSIA
jgi:hypothetical protein